MIDFHIHISPDGGRAGGLTPAEALRYAALGAYRAVALVTRSGGDAPDHLAELACQIRTLSLYANVEAFTGVELVHIPPALLPDAVRKARQAGAELVLVHGETLTDTVEAGTNLAAIEAGADILAHPGLVDEQAAAYAAEKGVALELSACPRHGLSNAHVAAMAERFGCALVPGSDIASLRDFTGRLPWDAVCKGAAMPAAQRDTFYNNARNMVKCLMNARKNA